MIVSTTKTEIFQSNTWNGSNIVMNVQFCITSKKRKVYIRSMIDLEFIVIQGVFYFASSDYSQMLISRQHEKS